MIKMHLWYGSKATLNITRYSTTVSTLPVITTTTINKSILNVDVLITANLTKSLHEVNHPDPIFLAYASEFPNYHLYIIHDNFLWKNSTLLKRRYPKHLKSYQTIYLRQSKMYLFSKYNENLFVVSQTIFCSVSFPNLLASRK